MPEAQRSLSQNEIDNIRASFRYCPDTGIFYWLKDVGQRGRCGQIAGSLWANPRSRKYIILTLNKKRYASHRIAILLHTGRPPHGEVDHINGDGTDNRLCNLRVCTKEQNQWNARKRRDNTTGYKGVSYHRQTGKYAARIQHNRKRQTIGLFDTPQAAHLAYVQQANLLFREFSRAG